MSAGINKSKRTSASRARLRWRRSINSQALGFQGRISRTAREALSRLSNNSKVVPRRPGMGSVAIVASVIIASVPSEPDSSRATSR